MRKHAYGVYQDLWDSALVQARQIVAIGYTDLGRCLAVLHRPPERSPHPELIGRYGISILGRRVEAPDPAYESIFFETILQR